MFVDQYWQTGTMTSAPVSETGSLDHDPVQEGCCPPLLGPTLTDDESATLAGVLKALADPVRLKLVNLVAISGECCACDLPELVGRSQPTISHHLSILVKAGILVREQRGKWAWFRLDRSRLQAICSALGTPALDAPDSDCC